MSKPLELLTLRANAPQFDPAQGEQGLPPKILVLAWGEHATTKGVVICDDTTMRQLAAFNAAQNWDRIALDFEHNSVPGSPTYAGEPVKIAGYGTLQLVAGEGIYLVMSSWTPEGKAFAAGGHYGDLSPVVKVNDRNEVIGLHSVALCRHGATPGLVFLSTAGSMQTPTAANRELRTANSTSSTMTPEQLIAKLAEMLDLAATATADEVLAALTEKMSAGEKELTAAKAEMEKNKTLSAGTSDELKLLAATLKEQGETLKLLTTQQLESQRGEIIAAAVREGKQVPSIAKSMALDDLKKLCAELPVTVPMSARTLEGVIPLSTLHSEAPEAKAVSEMTGVSDEDRKKYANR
jgi:phage I-like protein